jgi:hypothetical protein
MEQLLREALAILRGEETEKKAPLRDLPALSGHHPVGNLPSRADLYEELFSTEASDGRP